MLVCRIEVWPCGVQEQAREIGLVVIARRGKVRDGNTADYDVALCGSEKPAWIKGVKLPGFNRAKGPFNLLEEALGAVAWGRPTKRAKELIALVRQGGSLAALVDKIAAATGERPTAMIPIVRRRKAALNATVPGNAADTENSNA
jgi:hypothetical protein